MDKVYLDIPSDTELYNLLRDIFTPVDSIIAADIVVSENAYDFIDGKLFIVLGDSDADSEMVTIDKNMPAAFIAEAIKAAVAGASVFNKKGTPQTAYHVIGADESKSEYIINKLHTILNAAPESIVEIDADGDILFNNIKFSDIYDPGVPVIVENIFKIFDKQTSEDIKNKIEKLPRGAEFEFNGRLCRKDGTSINIYGHVADIPGDTRHYEITFEDITRKLAKIVQLRKLEEQAIIAGFSRHLSHNILNALTAAGGFIRQIKSKTESTLLTQNLWHIVDGKLMLIEEIVSAYNDYTHALSLNPTEKCDIAEFYKELISSIAAKDFDRKFSAYLYKFTGNYDMEYDFSGAEPFIMRGNKLFLKLALCYILKDNIRYFGTDAPLEYKVTMKTDEGNFSIYIDIKGVILQDYITETMFKPWNHQVNSQSFDYWGIMVASAVAERHNGKLSVEKTDTGARFTITFLKPPF